MTLTYLDLRKRGRKLRLLHFQRLQNGRILVLNSLFLYVLVSALSAIYFALVRYQNWKVYYGNGHPRNLVMFTIQCWTGIFLAALVFTSGNVSALIMMSRKSRGFETASRGLILAQNFTLVGILVLYFGSTIPMSILTNDKANNLIEDALSLIERLQAAGTASRAGLPADGILKASLGEVLQQAQQLQEREAGLKKWIDGLLAIAIFFCFFFACAAIASLRFVLQLRQGKPHHASLSPPSRQLTDPPRIETSRIDRRARRSGHYGTSLHQHHSRTKYHNRGACKLHRLRQQDPSYP